MAEKNPNDPIGAVERIYKAWDEALGAKDLDAAVALYAPDATIESPLVAHLLGVQSGVCQGHDELRRFIRLVFQRQPAARKRFRTGYFTDGTKLMWEYPRDTPDGEQMDFCGGDGVEGRVNSAPPRILGLVRALNLKKRPTLPSPHCAGINPPSLMGVFADRGIPGLAVRFATDPALGSAESAGGWSAR